MSASRRSSPSPEEIRRQNLAALLRHVHRNGATSRAELTNDLGLNRSTIGALTSDLAAAGLVSEAVPRDSGRGRAGRPSLVVRPESQRFYAYALSIEVDRIRAARVGLGGELLDLRSAPRARDQEAHETAEPAAALVHDMQAEVPPDASCIGCGVVVCGMVRRADGMVRLSPNTGWVDEPFAEALRRALDGPITVTGHPVPAPGDSTPNGQPADSDTNTQAVRTAPYNGGPVLGDDTRTGHAVPAGHPASSTGATPNVRGVITAGHSGPFSGGGSDGGGETAVPAGAMPGAEAGTRAGGGSPLTAADDGSRPVASAKRPITVGNVADVSALAEHTRGAAKGLSNVIYLYGDVGIGAGIITGGRRLSGHAGYGGEVGHMVVHPGGRECGCGSRGCWETEIGERALLETAGRGDKSGRDAVLTVIDAARRGDSAADRAVKQVGDWLGFGVANLVNIFNPEVVLFGGTLRDVYLAAAATVRSRLNKTALPACREQLRLRTPE
ncbi:MAG: ROK family protein, partial [Stackebrandtia sp.]